MKGDLLLFPDADGSGFSWVRVAPDDGAVATGRLAAGATPPRGARGDRVVVLVPGEDVALHEVALPARTEAQARAAAAFAVEDLTAQALDEVHVVPGPRVAGDPRRVIAVTDRARFAAWRAALDGIGLEPERVAADYMALPGSREEVAVLDLGDRVLAFGGGFGFALEAALAPDALNACLAGSEARRVRLWTDRPDALLPPAARDGREIAVEPPLSEAAAARLFQRGLAEGPAVDLATADRAPDAGFAFDWRRWRAAAVLALAAGLGYAALLVAQTIALERETDAAYAEAERLVREAFPDLGRVVNPRAQLRARLGTGGGDERAFVALSGLVADSVRDIDTLEVDAIRFDAGADQLEVAIRYAAYDDVERLRAAVYARGGVLEEGGSRRMGEVMGGDVVVRPAP